MENTAGFTVYGLQKLTLLDYPGKVACTVFTGGCNFRCPFCHNADLVLTADGARIPLEEVFAFLAKRTGVLDGVCITGGEPTLQPGLEAFVRRVRALGLSVKLDTNGAAPAVLRRLLDEGLLDAVAMDIKNDREHYAAAAGVAVDISAVERSAAMLLDGTMPFEFRTTVVRELHTVENMRAIGRWLQGPEPYFLQTFVDSGRLLGSGMSACTPQEMQTLLEALRAFVPGAALR